MIEIRIHGRGGQGTVLASKILVAAAVFEGKEACAIPDFTFERRGAPVKAYVKIDEEYIWEKTQVYNPDVLVVLDPTVKVDFYEGISENCSLVINLPSPPEIPKKVSLVGYVDANAITIPLFGMPVPNMCMLGAFAKTTGLVSLESIERGISEIMEDDELVERNLDAARAGYERVRVVKG